MKAILTGGVTHWLADDDWTLCGRNPHVLKGGDLLDLETLGDRGCPVCEEMRKHPSKQKAQPFTYAGPGYGRLRTVGPLYHGLKTPRHGQTL